MFDSIISQAMKNRFRDIRMGVDPECYPCFLRQANIAMEMAGVDADTAHRVMRSVLRSIGQADLSGKTPAHITSPMHRRIRRLLKTDPFRGVKARYNRIAMKMYPELKQGVALSTEPLATAARLAIAGNVIDFGIFRSVDIRGTVERALTEPMAVDDIRELVSALSEVAAVLYLLDNAGEVVFDRILIEELLALGKQVTVVVKSGPVINDCTRQDAASVGLDDICRVIDNGSDSVGTIFDHTSRSFLEHFNRKDQIIISKGQANFETLMHEDRRIFFLFQSKCAVVSRHLGLEQGAMLLARGGGR